MFLLRRNAAWTIPAVIVLTLAAGGAGYAQAPASATPAAANPQMAAAQASFEAWPQAERKAIQADLIWAGGFTGATSGSFGALTFRAINSFKSGRGPADGMLPAPERAALAKAAQAARDAAGFRLIADEKTGVRIGVPTKLLPKRDINPAGGSRWQSADGAVTLDTSAAPPGDELAQLFEKAITVSPNSPRKITYKLLRPDFFVVTGETPTGKFYRRLTAGPQGLRGFSIGYDKAQGASIDKLVIAIAGSFDPFPSGPMPSAAPVMASAGASAAMAPAAVGPAPARINSRSGVALLVGDKLALGAATSAGGCRSLSIGGRTARLRTKDEASGLALFDLDGSVAVKPIALGEPVKAGAAVVLMAYAGNTTPPQAQALPGESAEANGRPSVVAPLQPGQAGAPVFDRRGRLVGAVAAEPSGKLVAGIAPQQRYALAGPEAIAALLSRNGASLPAPDPSTGSELSTGAVVAGIGPAVAPLVCGL